MTPARQAEMAAEAIAEGWRGCVMDGQATATLTIEITAALAATEAAGVAKGRAEACRHICERADKIQGGPVSNMMATAYRNLAAEIRALPPSQPAE